MTRYLRKPQYTSGWGKATRTKRFVFTGVSVWGKQKEAMGGLMDLRKGKPQNIQQVRKTAVNKHSLERAAGQFKNSS